MDKVCAIVVTYRPSPDVLANVEAIRRQVARLVVVDNGSTANSRALLAPLGEVRGVDLVFNPTNFGIAAALNQGVARALEERPEWIVTFDQDSTPADTYIGALLRAAPNLERAGMLAPLYRDADGPVYSPCRGPVADPARPEPVSIAVTSGSLMRTRMIGDVGGFREDFFIDCVDHEFSLRCRRRGWLIWEVGLVVLMHRQGQPEQRRFGLLRPTINDYPADRRYYQARNRLVVAARYVWFDPRWVALDMREYLRELAKLILMGRDRGPKLMATLRGWRDALDGRMGPRRP